MASTVETTPIDTDMIIPHFPVTFDEPRMSWNLRQLNSLLKRTRADYDYALAMWAAYGSNRRALATLECQIASLEARIAELTA